MLTGSQGESGPTTTLPDKKLLLFILDRLQKYVSCFLSFFPSSFLFSLSFFLPGFVLLLGGLMASVYYCSIILQKGHSWGIL